MLRMRPPVAMAGSSDWMSARGANTFTRYTRDSSWSGYDASGGCGLGPSSEALLTSASSGPRSATAPARARRWAGSATSPATAITRAPDPASSARAASSAPAPRASMTRSQPSAARARASPSPNPLDAPVTSAVGMWTPSVELVKQVITYFIDENPGLLEEISGNGAGVTPAALLAPPQRTTQPRLPQPRGPLSEAVLAPLVRAPGPVSAPAWRGDDPLVDDDLQLALYACYELHYRGFDGVDDAWEWEPSLLAVRRQLEHVFEDGLRAAVRDAPDDDDDRSLSEHMERDGTLEQLREFAVHRSPYQLKEADPHTWGIPRIAGEAKALMVHIQADEYGDGDAAAMHATRFADTM